MLAARAWRVATWPLAIAALAALVALAGCRDEPRCARRADHAVIACVDNQPVLAAEVAEHLRPARAVPGRVVIEDPRRRALDDAIGVRLLAAEATRRGLTATGPPARRRSALYQAVLRDEADRQGAVAAQITDDEARGYYQANVGLFNKITAVEISALIVADPARAEQLYAQAQGLDEAGFASLARASSEDASAPRGGALGEAHADGVDPALTRLANDLRAAGAIGGPVTLADGRHAVLRATSVELAIKPFDDTMARTVKARLAHDREQLAVAALELRLRGAHAVEVFADELARLPTAAVAASAAATAVGE